MATFLRDIATSGELAVEIRTDAAVALGRNSDRDGAVEILRSLPQYHTPSAARVRIAEAITALNPDMTDAAEAVLQTMSAGTGGPAAAVRAAELLAEFGRSEQAVNLAWSVINDNDGALPAQTTSAIRTILRYQGADGAARLLHAADGQSSMGRPMLRWILIELTQWGASDHVIDFCRQALADPGTITWQWSSVAGGWSFAAGPSATTEIFHILDQRGRPYEEAAGEVSCACWKRGTWMRHSKSRWALALPGGAPRILQCSMDRSGGGTITSPAGTSAVDRRSCCVRPRRWPARSGRADAAR